MDVIGEMNGMVLVIGMYTRTYMPYVKKYENILKVNGIEYELTCFDRDISKNEIEKTGNVYFYRNKVGTSKIRKLIPYIKYFCFVRKLIQKKQYDRIIVLTTIPAVFFQHILIGRYRNKYLFDFRDISFEKYSFYRKRVNKIINNSYASFLSSKGFFGVLKNDSVKMHLVHNSPEKIVNTYIAKEFSSVIEIGFVGYVRYFDVNSKMVRSFKNRRRYHLSYVGIPYDDCDIKGLCEKEDIQNVSFVEFYKNEEKEKIYSGIDIINSIYSLRSKEVVPAIPNRIYDAAMYKKPILVSKGTYLAELVQKYGVGCVIDCEHDDFYQKVEAYVAGFDCKSFEENCNRFLKDIEKDERTFEKIVGKFISGGDI